MKLFNLTFVMLILASLMINVSLACKTDSCGWNLQCTGYDGLTCICLKKNANRKVTCIGFKESGRTGNVYLKSGGPADYIRIISGSSEPIDDFIDDYTAGYNCACGFVEDGKRGLVACGSL